MKTFHEKCGLETSSRGFSIPDFGVSRAILNPVENFRWWCKLNFGLLRGHVKSCQFTAILLKGYYARRQYFFILFKGISWNNWLGSTLNSDLNLLLPFKQNWIGLGPR